MSNEKKIELLVKQFNNEKNNLKMVRDAFSKLNKMLKKINKKFCEDIVNEENS